MNLGTYISLALLVVVVLLVLVNLKKISPLFRNLKVFFEEVSFEMNKVTWPGRGEVINSTILVGVTSIILTGMIWLVDLVIGYLVRLIF